MQRSLLFYTERGKAINNIYYKGSIQCKSVMYTFSQILFFYSGYTIIQKMKYIKLNVIENVLLFLLWMSLRKLKCLKGQIDNLCGISKLFMQSVDGVIERVSKPSPQDGSCIRTQCTISATPKLVTYLL